MSLETKIPNFEALVTREHDRVFHSAYRILRDRGRAEDVVQEVFLAVVQGRLKLRGDLDCGAVLGWWAAKSALSALRAEKRRRAREEETQMQAGRQKDSVVRDDEARALWAEVAELPEPLSQAVWARFQDGKTLSAVAAMAGVSTTTAHERVRKGIEQLRARLGSTGAAALLPRLETILAHAPSVAPSSALVPTLLAIPGGASTAAAMTPVGALLAMLLLGTVVGAAVWIEPSTKASDLPSSPHLGSVEPADPMSVQTPGDAVATRAFEGGTESALPSKRPLAAVSEGEDRPALLTGILRGRVVDEVSLPVAGVLVIAESAVRDGKMSRFAARAKTDATGSYVLNAPVESSPERYHLHFGHAEYRAERLPEVMARANQETSVPEVHLMRVVDDLPGVVTLTVVLLDPEGRPVPKAGVGLLRRLRDGTSRHEVGDTADVHGVVRLTTTTFGSKTLVLNAQWLGFRNLERILEVDESAPAEIILRLDRGAMIAGRLLDPSGAVPTDVPLHVRDERTKNWWFGELKPEGRFEIAGLEEGLYTLAVGGQMWSTYTREGIPAGTTNLDIVVKPLALERAVGHHQAELHGRLVDAVTGEKVRADLFEVRACAVPTEDRATLLSTHVFAHLLPFLGQRMLSGEHPDDGGFHLDGLAAGTYIIAVRQPGYAPTWAGPFRLGDAEVRGALEIPLHRGAEVRGRVVDQGGRPVASAWVVPQSALGASGEWRTKVAKTIADANGRGFLGLNLAVQTDAEGEFALKGLPFGFPVELAAFHLGAQPSEVASFTLEVKSEPPRVLLALTVVK